uniref:uncharacterized protein n=1 Tax=Pristiophorus japonicus TaxID=55135 RepID=UPI00398EBDE8
MVCLEGRETAIPERGALPLRLIATGLWSSVTRRCPEHYERVLDFVKMIWQQAAGLITYRHYLKLCIAFKAKLVMEMFVQRRSLLDILQTLDRYFPRQVPGHPRATRRDAVRERQCLLQFRKQVLLLIRDEEYREQYLQDELEEEYGNLFMAAAQRLLWEFLERLESALPQPRINQLLSACVDVRCLSPGEQALVSVLLDPPTSVPDVLLALVQQIRQQHRLDQRDPSRTGSETGSGIPGISSAESVRSGGCRAGAEHVTPDPRVEGQGNNPEPTCGSERHRNGRRAAMRARQARVHRPGTANGGGKTVNRNNAASQHGVGGGTGLGPAPGRKRYPWRNTPGREHHRETIGSAVGQGQHLVFSALHFDQSCDEQFEDQLMPMLSPPDPLQSQGNLHSTSPVPAWTHPQIQATEPQSQPLRPPGLRLISDRATGKCPPGTAWPGQAPSSGPPQTGLATVNQTPGNGIGLQVLAAAPVSREVQEQLAHSALFQPQVHLLRLSVDPSGQPTMPERRGLQREDRGRGGGYCQLGGAANWAGPGLGQNPPPGRWNLRERPWKWRLKAAEEQAMMLLNYSGASLLFSSEDSTQSDASDYEYFPFCSQLNLSGR